MARISHGKGDGKAFSGLGVRTYVRRPETGSCERFRAQARFSEFEGGITEAVAEGETRRGSLCIVPAVTYIYALGIVFVQEVGVFPGNAGILAFRRHGSVFHLVGDGERKMSGRVHGTGEHVGQGAAGFAAQVPVLENSRHFRRPGHADRVAGDIDNHQVGVGFSQGFDDGVLSVRQTEGSTVVIFCILSLALVEAADKENDIGLGRSGHGIGDELVGRARFGKVNTCQNAVKGIAGIAHIAPFIGNLRIGPGFPDPLQRRNFV